VLGNDLFPAPLNEVQVEFKGSHRDEQDRAQEQLQILVQSVPPSHLDRVEAEQQDGDDQDEGHDDEVEHERRFVAQESVLKHEFPPCNGRSGPAGEIGRASNSFRREALWRLWAAVSMAVWRKA
jgi:hypothetical protein